jgi:hypothetical protein
MFPTRRDIVRLGTALGLGATMPTGAERIRTMQILKRPLSDDWERDPGAFTGTTGNQIGNVTRQWW